MPTRERIERTGIGSTYVLSHRQISGHGALILARISDCWGQSKNAVKVDGVFTLTPSVAAKPPASRPLEPQQAERDGSGPALLYKTAARQRRGKLVQRLGRVAAVGTLDVDLRRVGKPRTELRKQRL